MATVLVLEDEPFVFEVIRAVLRRSGRNVVGAQTTEAATRAAERQRVDLLVAGVILPDQNGPVVAGRLLELNPRMGCLFISGYPREELNNNHLLDTTRVGTDAILFLPKPFTSRELIGMCDWLLGIQEKRAA